MTTTRTTRFRFWLWLIQLIGVIVPRRLRADWRQEWEAELQHRESLLREWDRLKWRAKFDLLRRSTSAFWDALWLQTYRWEDAVIQDLRFGVRMLLKHKAFTSVAVITLALGIGANTAIFSVINALLLRPLPYSHPEQLVKVFQAQLDPTKGMLPSLWAYPRFEILRDQNQGFAGVAGFAQNDYNLTGTDSPERLHVETVSASYFSLLGIEAIVGRRFTVDEDQVSAVNLPAMLSYGLWQRRFGGDDQVVGKTIEIEKHSFTVTGILPPGFRGQSGTADAWVTMNAAPALRYHNILATPTGYWFQVIARLRDDVSLAQAQAEMPRISEQIEQKYPSPKATLTGTSKVPLIVPLQAAKVDPAIKTSFLILLAAVALVLLIACANVANLLLARAFSRQREFALRAALGAGHWRLMRQLITESLLLSLLGGILGVLVARWGVELLKEFRPSDNARFWSSYTRAFDFFTLNLDWRVLNFNFALALFTGVLFGLVPALQSSFVNLNEALKTGSGGSAKGFQGLRKLSPRSLLVVVEVSLSVVLLVSAGLMLKSLGGLQSINLGFAPENVMTMAAPSRNAKTGFYEQLLARVQALPGVESASLGSTAPLLGYNSRTVVDIEGHTDVDQAAVGHHSVSPDYFATLGIALLGGRVFNANDRVGAPRVAIINQAAAERFFAGEDPIGKRLRTYIAPQYETEEKFVQIIGVVANVRYGRLEEAIEPDLYVSSLQPTDPAQILIVRTKVNSADITAAVRHEMIVLDRNVPLAAVQTMKGRAAEVTSRTRFIAVLLALFAALALMLAGIGIYGVMAFSVSARTREVGIRLALGAQARDALKLVIGQGLQLALVGVAGGLTIAFVVTRALKSLLFGVSATDPLIFFCIALLLGSVAFIACWIPARRAAKVDPITALRHE